MTKEALTLLVHEMEYVLSCINEDKIPFDGDDFHEALRLGKEALAQEKALQALHDENERLGLYKDAYAEPERESKRLQCVTCGTVYADGVPPKVAQPKQEKERCVGCEACIETACGRDECPKGWPKAAHPKQEPVAWKPDRSGKYLTVVYRDVIPGDEVGAIVDHPKCVIMSWSNAVHDVEQLKNTIPPQRTWVGLTDLENAEFVKTMERGNFLVAIYDIEKRLKEKNA